MKPILLSAFAAAAVTLSASAFEANAGAFTALQKPVAATAAAGTFRAKYHLDRPMSMQEAFANKNLAGLGAQRTAGDTELITDPQGARIRYAMSANLFLSGIGNAHVGGFGAEAVVSEDGATFYSRALTLNFFQQGYSAGDIEGDSIVFNSGQYIYDTPDNRKACMYAAYLAEGEDWPVIVDSFVLAKDEKGRYVSDAGYYFMVLPQEEGGQEINENTEIICFGTDYVFTPLPADLTENVMPDDAEVFECQLLANSLANYGDLVTLDVTIGVSGDRIYIGGLCNYLPGSYLMGTKSSDNTYTFDTHQYLGAHDEGEFPYIYEFAMVNPMIYEDESFYFAEADSVVMTFNDDKSLLSLEEYAGVFVCAYGDLNSWEQVYWNMRAGDFNQPLTPKAPTGVNFYDSYGSPYIIFEWDNISVEGMPMNGENLWCEVIINGQPYEFRPEYYEGLSEATDRIYYNTTGVSDMYVGSFSTVYFKEFADNAGAVRSIGLRVGYQSGDETRCTDIVYADGFEPFEDKAYVPSATTDVVYFKDYSSNIRFGFDGKDIDGNPIPARIMAVEILLDGEPLVFKDSEYYFNGGHGADVTMIGLSSNSINYSSSIVKQIEGGYSLTLWGHSEIPDFRTVAVRPVCIGGDTITYGQACEAVLDRPATPANPWDVTYSEEDQTLTFGALPVAVDGIGLAPWLYGYEVYVNGSLYTFKADLYDLDEDATLIPYEGFAYNYDFYLHTESIYDETTWAIIDEKVVMSVSMDKEDGLDVNTIGVRAVYTDGEGHTTYSDIVNSDGTSGAALIGSDNEGPVRWYNLQGIEVAAPEAGAVYLRQQGGRTVKVYVK